MYLKEHLKTYLKTSEHPTDSRKEMVNGWTQDKKNVSKNTLGTDL